MSSGEEFEVDEILEQRKRKGVLEYLVRWQGFNQLYDSWEPAAGLAHCKEAIKTFLAKSKRSRSKSRSRSRGRQASQSRSKSRSTSRGRAPKSPATPAKSRSRSRSASRKTPQTAAATRSSRKTKETAVVKKEASPAKKKEASPAKEEKRGRPRARSPAKAAETKVATKAAETRVTARAAETRVTARAAETRVTTKVSETKATPSRSSLMTQRSSTRREAAVLERRAEVVQRSVESVRATPVRRELEAMTTRSRLAVRQVENDQKPSPKKSSTSGDSNTWVWWFADHAVLILFIIISIIALSFTIESVSGVRDKLVPDFSVLRQRLVESYEHSVEAISHGFNSVVNILPTWGDSGSSKDTPAPKASSKSTGA